MQCSVYLIDINLQQLVKQINDWKKFTHINIIGSNLHHNVDFCLWYGVHMYAVCTIRVFKIQCNIVVMYKDYFFLIEANHFFNNPTTKTYAIKLFSRARRTRRVYFQIFIFKFVIKKLQNLNKKHEYEHINECCIYI